MSASNRAGAIAKLHTALKKHYTPEPAQPTRPLLEHILYASLLEDCPAELADEGLAKCEQEFFDWNEVRVTTVTELSQVLSSLPDPAKAATRLKGNLQGIFEEFYTFDLDHLKKENLGKAIAKFEKMPGMTPFVLNYLVQHGLGGHAVPIDFAAMSIMLVTGIASQSEATSGRVPGLERAIPKSKAIEFSSLLHQAAVALIRNPKDKTARTVLDSVEKGASGRLDDWLSNKVEAKKQRAAQREADRAAAEEAAVAQVTEPVVEPTPAKSKASKKNAETPAETAPAKPAKAAAGAKTSGKAPGADQEVKPAEKSKPSAKKSAPIKTATKPSKKPAKPSKPAESSKPAEPAKPAESSKPAEPAPAKGADAAKPAATSKPAEKKKTSANKSTPAPKPAKTAEPKSKKSASKSKPVAPKTPSKKSAPAAEKSSGSKKSANRKLTKSKPR